MGAIGGIGGTPIEWDGGPLGAEGPPAEAPSGAAAPPTGARAEVAALPFGRGARVREIGPGPHKLAEPSGVAFHAGRGTLFVAGDRGHLVEMTRDGEVLNRRKIKDLDIEGVTIGPGGRVYTVVEEGPPRILEIDPETLEVSRSFKVDPKLDGKRVICRRENDGLEGICYVPEDGAFYCLNQGHPPRIVKLDLPLEREKGGRARIAKCIDLEKAVDERASDLAFDPATRHFLVTGSGGGKAGKLHEVTRHGKHVRSVALPGSHQEGFAIDDRGAAFIAQDSGGVLRIDR